MSALDASRLYDAFYFATGCGRPYQRDEVWLRFFGGIADRIIRDIGPRTVLDAGCALGFLVESLRGRGVEAEGIDISDFAIGNVHPSIRSHCRLGSVTQPFGRRYDLIVCIEVLEHLPARAAEEAVANFCQHADDVLFSSSPSDFKEATHCNVRPPEYWAEQFARHGFFRDVDFDASFITPWAVRFRRSREPFSRTVAAYERRLWQLQQQHDGARQLAVEQRNQLAEREQADQKLRAELAVVQKQCRDLQRRWEELEQSVSGSLLAPLDCCRRMLAPAGTARGRWLDRLGRALWLWRHAGSRELGLRLLEKICRRARAHEVPAVLPPEPIPRTEVPAMSIVSPAQALWNQRQRLGSLSGKLRTLMHAVDKSIDFSPFQWVSVTAFALEFRPDLILELGRDRGNSTCCFLEVANQLGGATACRVVSLDWINTWADVTVPRLRKVCPPEWFAPAEVLQGDILRYDATQAVSRSRRCLVFWDAHGFEIAEWVLGHLLPLLKDRSSVVVMHDLTDRRYCAPPREYGTRCSWKSLDPREHSYWFGPIASRVGQAVSMIDFSTRNEVPLHSADESLFTELWNDPAKQEELRRLLGDELLDRNAHWFWFSLNEAGLPLVFPSFQVEPQAVVLPGPSSPSRLRRLSQRYPQLAALVKKVLRRAA